MLALALAFAVHAAAQTAISSRTAGNLRFEDVPEIPPALSERMLQYQNTRSVSLAELDAAGQGMLIATRFGETSQLHWVDRPLGARRQITFLKEPVRGARLRPGRRQAVYSTDRGGAEDYQLYLYDFGDGASRLITDGKSRHESVRWSRGGDLLAFVNNSRNGKDMDFYVLDPDSGPPRRVRENEGNWEILDWSPDGLRLLVNKYVSIHETYPHILDVKTGAVKALFETAPGAKVAYGSALWSAGGAGVTFTSDEGREFMTLGRLDLASRKVRWLTSDIPWDVDELEVSRDGTRTAFAVNADGANDLYLLGPKGRRRVPGLPAGLIGNLGFSADGRRLAFTLTSARSPGDAYTVDAQTLALTRWTQSETGGLPAAKFIEPVLVRYPTFDAPGGRPRLIPCWWYQAKSPGKRPFVVLIHGGPEAQSRPWFSPTVQYWVSELGLSVLMPNVRGSSGYGKSYLLLDNGFQREDSVKDIGALLDWAATRAELDSSRAAVYGGSYGGYMSLASLATFRGRLRAGVDIVGISNFVTFLENTRDYRRDLRRVEYGDERDPAMRRFLEGISPTANAGLIDAPLFVVQGANDPRVPAGEAEQIVRAVRAKQRQVWYMLAKDEGHGFVRKSNRDQMDEAVALFWQRHLLGEK